MTAVTENNVISDESVPTTTDITGIDSTKPSVLLDGVTGIPPEKNKDRGDSNDWTVSTVSDTDDTISVVSSNHSDNNGGSIDGCCDIITIHPSTTTAFQLTNIGYESLKLEESTVDDGILRCAILGCGMMGQEHCSYIMGYTNRVRIDYICDTHQPSIDKCLNVMNEFRRADTEVKDGNHHSNNHHNHHIPIVVTSEEELLSNYVNNIDLLVVATPNYLHTDVLVRWGQYEHLTILVEKPVSVSYDQHSTLTKLVTGSNNDSNDGSDSTSIKAKVWVAMEYRFIPAIAKLIDLIPSVVGDIKMVTIRENRYPFLHKIGAWNRDYNKTGDTLVEKCCHFFDLMRLITGQEVKLDKVRSIVQRGINYEDEPAQDVPIIDSAYVILPFVNNDENKGNASGAKRANTTGCLELCMFAEGSRHQEEIIVTGTKGRLEAYLPENKVYAFTRPSSKEWSDRSIPPPSSSIEKVVYDCSNVKSVHGIDTNAYMPTHGGYHYSSTAVEWYKLLHAIDVNKKTGVWNPLVSIHDGLRAVEIGLQATQSIVNDE